MNKRLDEEIAKKVAEKRGHKWALTNLAYKAWKQTEAELEESQVSFLSVSLILKFYKLCALKPKIPRQMVQTLKFCNF